MSIKQMAALITSVRLWGGMLVAMPTAMPEEPLTSKLGKRLGSTVGCISVSSKFGMKSTVSLSISPIRLRVILDMRASV